MHIKMEPLLGSVSGHLPRGARTPKSHSQSGFLPEGPEVDWTQKRSCCHSAWPRQGWGADLKTGDSYSRAASSEGSGTGGDCTDLTAALHSHVLPEGFKEGSKNKTSKCHVLIYSPSPCAPKGTVGGVGWETQTRIVPPGSFYSKGWEEKNGDPHLSNTHTTSAMRANG
jgi:hypothetical protein